MDAEQDAELPPPTAESPVKEPELGDLDNDDCKLRQQTLTSSWVQPLSIMHLAALQAPEML